MKRRNSFWVFLAATLIALISFLVTKYDSQDNNGTAYAQNSSITILSLTKDNQLIPNAEYSISPDPFKSSGSLKIKDNSSLDGDADKNGIITLSGVRNGNYTVSQIGIDSGFSLENFSKIIEVKDSTAVVSFTNKSESEIIEPNNSIQTITYNAKFVCGSINGAEGPLRPGHYDTDISIFNKQKFPIKFLWNAVINDGPSSNSILKNLDTETSTGIDCKQIRNLLSLGTNDEELVEGFVIIRIELDSMLETSGEKTLRNISENQINLLDVQAFYTANALSTLPHEVIIDKISFYIIQDETGKIPKDMFRKTLDISLPSQANELSNSEMRVKRILMENYDLSEDDLSKIVVRIKDVSVGVGSLVDDHAISLHVVIPQSD